MHEKPSAVIFDINWNACIRCGACVSVCLQRQPFVSSFETIAIDTPCEIACMQCVEACPTSALSPVSPRQGSL